MTDLTMQPGEKQLDKQLSKLSLKLSEGIEKRMSFMPGPYASGQSADDEEALLVQQMLKRRREELEIRGGGPTQIGSALREVIARRKIGRQLENQELKTIWAQAIDAEFLSQTRVVSLRNRVLLVEVSDSVLLSEMVNFHQASILRKLRKARPDWELRSIKFRLNARLANRESES